MILGEGLKTLGKILTLGKLNKQMALVAHATVSGLYRVSPKGSFEYFSPLFSCTQAEIPTNYYHNISEKTLGKHPRLSCLFCCP
jgi:hypothetical protein